MATFLAISSGLCATAALLLAWVNLNDQPHIKAAREEEDRAENELRCTSDEIGLWVGRK